MSIIIDAHVHIYPEFSISQLFESAFVNFAQVNGGNGREAEADQVLFLTEGARYHVYADLHKRASSGEWLQENTLRLLPTDEENSLVVQKDSGHNNRDSIYVFPGRQYVSKEKIELLALFAGQHIEDRTLTLEGLYREVVNNGGIVVIPWGVGKWWGKRGKVVKELLDCSLDGPIFLGDNGNRPVIWPTPFLLRYAEKRQIGIVSGSDPLPLPSHYSRAASSGTILMNGELSQTHPAESLYRQLKNKNELLEFGRRMQVVRFFYDQLRLIF